ncbi:MAG: ABC transporter ATP-binding protein [Thermoplasmata archaeon]|nr:ABC transporter ATP-binding protein [Thermoplasmata archaeon]
MSGSKGPKAVVLLDKVSTVYEGERFPAIRDVSLCINAGDFVCVIGPNGSGKTTLLETVNGILRNTSGNVRVFGLDVTESGHSVRTRTGYVIQNFEIDPLSPFLCKNVVMSGRVGKIGLLRFPSERDWAIVDESMRLVGMDSSADRPIGKLSGGEFQKILLARAIAQEPEMFLLDEPFANLDLKSRADVDRLISDLNRKGATTVMVSHDIDSIPFSCSHIIVMNRGRVAAFGPRDELLQNGVISSLMKVRGSAV